LPLLNPLILSYWLVAAGSLGRDYTEDFLKYGMAFVGGNSQIAKMSRVNIGDVVVLKRGLKEIVTTIKTVFLYWRVKALVLVWI